RKIVNLLLCVAALVTVFFLPSLFDALAVTQTILSTPLFLSLSIAAVLCAILQVVIGALLLLKVTYRVSTSNLDILDCLSGLMCILRKTTRRQVRTKQVLMIMPKSILLICAGFISLAVFHFSQTRIPLNQYQFEYSVYETIGNTNVST